VPVEVPLVRQCWQSASLPRWSRRRRDVAVLFIVTDPLPRNVVPLRPESVALTGPSGRSSWARRACRA
jgi:hypothetical protein